MALAVAEISLVSPLGLSPSEHVFFWRAEVGANASGAFVDRDDVPLPIHDCPWIPATRPWGSRVRLLARQALARLDCAAPRVPVLLVAPRAALEGEADLPRFLSLSGHRVAGTRVGSAAYVLALREAERLLASEPEVVVLAVDSLLSPEHLGAWHAGRKASFVRPPPPPSEGAAAVRLVASTRGPLAGQVRSLGAARSEATDDNDLPADGALGRAFAELQWPAQIPLVVGPRDVDPLRMRDFQLAAMRHHARIDRAEMPSLEGRVGALGAAAGLMSAVFAMAWLRHGLPLPEMTGERTALAWARSADGTVAAAVLGEGRS
jgi:hypothetical protein